MSYKLILRFRKHLKYNHGTITITQTLSTNIFGSLEVNSQHDFNLIVYYFSFCTRNLRKPFSLLKSIMTQSKTYRGLSSRQKRKVFV